MSARSRRRHADDGFTLVELLVTIAITGIILSSVTIAVSMGFERTAEAERRADHSNVAEFTARYFGADVASSGADQTGVTACPGSGAVLSMIVTDGRTVTYQRAQVGAKWVLSRTLCSGPSVVASQELGSSRDEFTASGSCPGGGGAQCTLSVTWASGDGDFTLRGSRRAG